jgi:DNA-binding transcriptional ArsR family regulator
MTAATPSRRTPAGVGQSAPDAVALAELCKAGADELRLLILRLLRRDAMGVSELCEVLDVRQPALSHHLKLMSRAGLLESQRDGNHIFYRRRALLTGDCRTLVQRALLQAADDLPLSVEVTQRLEALQARREENSREFFRSNAGRFREQQDLIAGPERYAQAVLAALDALPGKRRGLALEIGPGEGWLLPELAQRFAKVVAVDNAAEMLARSEALLQEQGIDNTTLYLADTGSPALRGLDADLAVLNMVLHHTPDPGQTLREAAAALKPGGALLVTDLCEHDQGWARESCGDLWLGFAPQQVLAWAQDAGLSDIASNYLAQRNGFRIQVRLFGAPSTIQ